METTSASKRTRTISAIAYLTTLALIQFFVIGDGFPINEKLLWFANGAASLILGSRLLNPHFVPPADAATNSFVAGGTLVAALAANPDIFSDLILIWSMLALSALCFFASISVIILREPRGIENRKWIQALEKGVKAFGAPKTVFTFVILILAWVFHRDSATELISILASWTLIVALNPIEAVVSFASWTIDRSDRRDTTIIGAVAAHQSPGLVLIRQNDEVRYKAGTLMALSDDQGPTTLGVALNYVGRDDGILLRALSLPIPPALKSRADEAAVGSAAASLLLVDEDEEREVKVLERISSLCGIVDSDSDLEFIEIEVINDQGLAEGRLVDVKLRGEDVIYQIISGVTREDAVQQKNKYGYVRAKARKIGTWDDAARKFQPTEWLPRINAPVFLKTTDEFIHNVDAIGHFPGTDYQVSMDVSDAVTHNTAILGILGIGKSYLSIELVERMISQGIKVICLDLTDQYATELNDFVDQDYQNAVNQALSSAAQGRPAVIGKDEGGSVGTFNAAVIKAVSEFLNPETRQTILIFNPAEFRVSQQTTNKFKENDPAGFRDLTPCEITALFSSAALKASQELGMTDTARTCLVYEEAHSLVPEWNSVANDGDKNATAASARAILQGRKFGLGCLLVTQRTANVTKTILNQCNTIFAMRTFDDTGKDFLGNYIGSEYARILPTLKERHAVFFGKASSCDDPVLIRLNDRDKFIEAFRPKREQDD
ncbi:MAG: Bipolar DNA helicase HerA [Oceanicaulis sp. HLUCCA04]|nr:MAG: Bipolar DNA helicase HerA [Oceanicaulis sp. HLUCCA04]